MFLLLIPLLLGGAGFFGAQWAKDEANQNWLKDWLSGEGGLGMGVKGFGLFNMIAGFFNLFLPTGSKIELAGNDAILTALSADEATKKQLAASLEEIGLPNALSLELMSEPEVLKGVLEAAEINLGTQSLKHIVPMLGDKIYSPKVLKYLLTDPKASQFLFDNVGLDEATKAILIAARDAGDFAEASKDAQYEALSKALKEAESSADIIKILTGGVLGLMSTKRQGEAAMVVFEELLSNPGALKTTLLEKINQMPDGKEKNGALENLNSTVEFLSVNKDALKDILGADGMRVLSEMMNSGDKIPDLTNITSLLTNPNAVALRDIILERTLSGNIVENALKSLKFTMLPDEKLQIRSKLAVDILAGNAEQGAEGSNLDQIAALTANPKAFTTLMNAVEQFQTGASMDNIVIDKETANLVMTGLRRMDFDPFETRLEEQMKQAFVESGNSTLERAGRKWIAGKISVEGVRDMVGEDPEVFPIEIGDVDSGLGNMDSIVNGVVGDKIQQRIS